MTLPSFEYNFIFQIFRETKESELQNLLKARRDLESKLFKVAGHGILDDTESKVDASIGNVKHFQTDLICYSEIVCLCMCVCVCLYVSPCWYVCVCVCEYLSVFIEKTPFNIKYIS